MDSRGDDDMHRDRAVLTVRRLAAATNLLIAGRTFAVLGAGPDESALAELLIAFGGRQVRDPASTPADYVFCTGEGAAVDVGSIAVREGRPAVVIDAGATVAAIDVATLGTLSAARPGVLGTDAHPDIFIVPFGWGPGDTTTTGVAASTRDVVAAAELRLNWARRFMPVSGELARELSAGRRLDGVRIGVSMVLEPKTAVLALLLREAGAEVSVFSHADETDDAIADVLRVRGFPVDARSGPDRADDAPRARAFLDRDPQLILDDGSHIIRLAHRYRPERLAGVVAAAEETTSGLRPLRTMESAGLLRIPVIAVNDARSKTLFDNAYGTAQSCVFAILGLVDVQLRDAPVVVAGFGPVGEGVARTLRILGARVTVAETDPVRSLTAAFAGHRVARLIDAVRDAVLVVSATGVEETISVEVLLACAPDAVIAVAGGVPQEVAIERAVAAGSSRRRVSRKVESFTFPTGRSVRILDNGGCINITAGEGNPIEIMDLSFGVQLAAVGYILDAFGDGAAAEATATPVTVTADATATDRTSDDQRRTGVYPLPAAADDHVAELALAAFGLDSDARETTA